MKKIFIIVAIIATTVLLKGLAQTSPDSTNQIQPQFSHLLSSCYNLKDALVQGNANLASLHANEFSKILDDTSNVVIAKGMLNALVADANKISATTNLRQQREFFIQFSDKMIALVKQVKFTKAPIYKVYCPMKRSYWVSSEPAIKNPYFGSAMLTCGTVQESL